MSRGEPPAAGDLLRLSADMSGCISNLAVITRRLGVLQELNKFTANGGVNSPALAELVSNVEDIKQHSIMQKLDADFFARRAQIQRDAVNYMFIR
jgi:hypothetical protein